MLSIYHSSDPYNFECAFVRGVLRRVLRPMHGSTRPHPQTSASCETGRQCKRFCVWRALPEVSAWAIACTFAKSVSTTYNDESKLKSIARFKLGPDCGYRSSSADRIKLDATALGSQQMQNRLAGSRGQAPESTMDPQGPDCGVPGAKPIEDGFRRLSTTHTNCRGVAACCPNKLFNAQICKNTEQEAGHCIHPKVFSSLVEPLVF